LSSYLNHTDKLTGENTLIKDPERFPLILDRFQKSLASIVALIVLLGFAYKTSWIPGCIFIILVLHVIGIILYLSLPWDSWEWSSKDEVAKATFRRWSKRMHMFDAVGLAVTCLMTKNDIGH
jgi:uncharacterized membrane protein